MSFDERVDAVDLILKVLKEHEKNLDTLVSQLGDNLSQPLSNGSVQIHNYSKYKAILHKWFEFRDRCMKSDLIAFDIIVDRFQVSAIKNGSLFCYSENVPEMRARAKMEKEGDKVLIEDGGFMTQNDPSYVFNGKLQCGLGVKIRKTTVELPNGDTVHKMLYDIDPGETRLWLENELKTEKKSIVYGEIQI